MGRYNDMLLLIVPFDKSLWGWRDVLEFPQIILLELMSERQEQSIDSYGIQFN